MKKLNLTGMTLEQMEKLFEYIGQPKYRAAQLFNWIYKRRVIRFDDLTNFSKQLRQQLSESATIGLVSLEKHISASDNQTFKFLFKLEDGFHVESVFMIDAKRKTVCLSTQVGCP
ncbi:MAG TPA: 23S rRNA (adenine(2503)-C(2))-methyltransferase RlmN, partial [bacterium]